MSRRPFLMMCMLALVCLSASAEDAAAAPAPKDAVTGVVAGNAFAFSQAAVVPFAAGPDTVQIGIYQEQVDTEMPLAKKPCLILRVPKAGGTSAVGGAYGATFFTPPSANVIASTGQLQTTVANGKITCVFTVSADAKNKLAGTVTVPAPTP